jgi:hypothetical protein
MDDEAMRSIDMASIGHLVSREAHLIDWIIDHFGLERDTCRDLRLSLPPSFSSFEYQTRPRLCIKQCACSSFRYRRWNKLIALVYLVPS